MLLCELCGEISKIPEIFTGIKKGYLSQTANLFVNLKSNTMKNTLQIYGLSVEWQTNGREIYVL